MGYRIKNFSEVPWGITFRFKSQWLVKTSNFGAQQKNNFDRNGFSILKPTDKVGVMTA